MYNKPVKIFGLAAWVLLTILYSSHIDSGAGTQNRRVDSKLFSDIRGASESSLIQVDSVIASSSLDFSSTNGSPEKKIRKKLPDRKKRSCHRI